MGTDVTRTLDDIGFGKFQWLLLGYAGLAWVADACETMLLSFLGPAIECDWGVSSDQASSLTSVVFAGMLAGVYSLGILADHKGRRKGFFASALLLGSAGLASAFSRSFVELIVLRGFVGFGLGGTPIAITLFAEFIPSDRRGMWLLVGQGAWTVGTLLMSGIAWGTVSTPGLGWRWMLALGSLPLFILLGLYGWLPESPHWLAAHGREAEAMQVLMRVAKCNGAQARVFGSSPPGSERAAPTTRLLPEARPRSDSRTEVLDLEVPKSTMRRVRWALSQLYSTDLRATTVLLDGIWFINAITYYGLVLLCTELQTVDKKARCSPDHQPNLKNRDFLNITLTALSEAPGLLAAAMLIDRRGRKWTLRAGMALTGAAILLLPGVGRGSGAELALLFTSRAAIMGAYSVLYIYTPEIYPTQVRSFGLALCSAMSRVGGFLAPYATVSLVERGRIKDTLWLLGGLCVAAFIAAFFLVHETRGRDLQAPRLGPEQPDEDPEESWGSTVGPQCSLHSGELTLIPRIEESGPGRSD